MAAFFYSFRPWGFLCQVRRFLAVVYLAIYRSACRFHRMQDLPGEINKRREESGDGMVCCCNEGTDAMFFLRSSIVCTP